MSDGDRDSGNGSYCGIAVIRRYARQLLAWPLITATAIAIEPACASNLLPRPQAWVAVNDGVMGGLSHSHYLEESGYAGVFQGEVSLKNNGGFASVRASLTLSGENVDDALRLSVIGDGKTYSLRLHTDDAFSSIAYAANVKTLSGEISEHRLALSDFQPVWRGRAVTNAPPLLWKNVRQIGVMISGKQEGTFRLRLVSLKWASDSN